MGNMRMLRRWILFPLKDVKPIQERQEVVDYFFREPETKELLDTQLEQIGDLERIISKVLSAVYLLVRWFS